MHCIQYKIVVVYSFGNKNWQQLSVTSHNQRYLQERNDNSSFYQLPFFPTGSNDNFKCISCGFVFENFCFSHIPPIPNIKTCSISLPLSLDACKENIGPLYVLPISWLRMLLFTQLQEHWCLYKFL